MLFFKLLPAYISFFIAIDSSIVLTATTVFLALLLIEPLIDCLASTTDFQFFRNNIVIQYPVHWFPSVPAAGSESWKWICVIFRLSLKKSYQIPLSWRDHVCMFVCLIKTVSSVLSFNFHSRFSIVATLKILFVLSVLQYFLQNID